MTKKPTTAQDNTPTGLMAKVKEFKSYLELSRTEIQIGRAHV